MAVTRVRMVFGEVERELPAGMQSWYVCGDQYRYGGRHALVFANMQADCRVRIKCMSQVCAHVMVTLGDIPYLSMTLPDVECRDVTVAVEWRRGAMIIIAAEDGVKGRVVLDIEIESISASEESKSRMAQDLMDALSAWAADRTDDAARAYHVAWSRCDRDGVASDEAEWFYCGQPAELWAQLRALGLNGRP